MQVKMLHNMKKGAKINILQKKRDSGVRNLLKLGSPKILIFVGEREP